jgi:hypothetical protein
MPTLSDHSGSVTALPQRGHTTECGIDVMPPMLVSPFSRLGLRYSPTTSYPPAPPGENLASPLTDGNFLFGFYRLGPLRDHDVKHSVIEIGFDLLFIRAFGQPE